ncbi:hypothetical protein C1T21_15530 [Paenibacillus sp. F4]|nr:hypothetical protein C1T21_15530 [Paenibacillus sp. F4]
MRSFDEAKSKRVQDVIMELITSKETKASHEFIELVRGLGWRFFEIDYIFLNITRLEFQVSE